MAIVTKKSKYRNVKAQVDGIKFDSKREAARYSELKLMQRAGLISELELQKEFVVIPAQKGERATKYRADFSYIDEDGNHVTEDVKGILTSEYIIKRKLMLKEHGIKIREIK